MKNKMMKGAHLSERKCKEIIRLFCEDLTATQIAQVCGVSRVTINNYLRLTRTHLAKYCEERNPRYRRLDVYSFVPVQLRQVPEMVGDDLLPDEQKSLFYGITQQNGIFFIDQLTREEYDLLYSDVLPGKLQVQHFLDEKFAAYLALIDINNWRLVKINAAIPDVQLQEELAAFWSLTKSRLLKFRGLNRNTAYLHIKECEFRYNYRNEDLFKMINAIIQRRPLHYSKAE